MTRSRTSAFTFLEVLVALAVIGLVLPPLLINAAERVHGLKIMEDRMIANMVAQNQLAMYRLAGRLKGERPPRTEEGSETMADREWFWRASSSPTEAPDFFRMTIAVASDKRLTLTQPEVEVSAYFSVKESANGSN